MTNIAQLERDWKIYKRKEQKPFLLFTLFILVVLGLVLLFSSTNTEPNASVKTSTSIKENNITVTIPKPVTKVKPIKVVQELTPSFSFMKEIKNSRPQHKVTRKKPTRSVRRDAKPAKRVQAYREPKRESSHNLSVHSSSANSKLSSLAERFNKHRDPNLGILVAKQYYKNKDYKKSYFYALEVNTIDTTNEESWIITAKSLYFLKNKAAAIKLLNTYLRKNSSAEAIRVYRAIRQGRLK